MQMLLWSVGDNGTYQIMFHAQVEMTRKPTTRPECINNWPRRVLGAAKASRRHALAEWKKASSALTPHSSEKFPVEFSVADNSQSDAMFPTYVCTLRTYVPARLTLLPGAAAV